MALLAGLHHDRATHPRIGELLAIVESSDLVTDPDSPLAANTRELRRSYDRRVKLPRDLVEALARTTSLAQQEWISARRDADFDRFRPWLEKIVQLKYQEAACLAPIVDSAAGELPVPAARKPPIYDALLDDYEPGARSHELAVLFQSLREQLVPLVAVDRRGLRQAGKASRGRHSPAEISARPAEGLRRGGGGRGGF